MRSPWVPTWTRSAVPPAFVLLALALVLVGLRGGLEVRSADFVFNNGAEVATLDPAAATGVPEGRVLAHLYEGLVSRDPVTGEPGPGVAKSWMISPNGRTFTFRLRDDARWSNGDPLTAHDFEWSFRRLLSPKTAAQYAYLLWPVRGAEPFSTEVGEDGEPLTPWEDVGIHAVDDRTLRIVLERPVPYFLDLLSYYPTFPVHRGSLERARRDHPDTWSVEWLKPANLVTNGPFRLVERRVNDRIRLRKNLEYWDADRVAFGSIDILAIDHVTTALNLYLTGEVDWIERVPTNMVPLLIAREDFHASPYLGVYFYRINTTKPPLDDKWVRKALALGLSRRSIVHSILKAGQAPAWSLVPPGFAGYPSATLERKKREADNHVLATKYLRQAGYGPRGEEFPSIEIHYNKSEVHRDIAEVVADGWRNALDVEARLVNQEWKVHLDSQSNLNYDISRSSWIADYPDPMSFLEIFVSGGENNRTGWANPEYDALIRAASLESEPRKRMRHLNEAEAILMDEVPIIPIYFYVSQNLVNPRLGGFHANAQDEHSPKSFYWMDNRELRKKRAKQKSARPAPTPVGAPGPAEGLYPPAGRKTWTSGP